MWNRPCDAWLNIWGLNAAQRNRAFEELQNENQIAAVRVDGIKDTLYCCAEALSLMEELLKQEYGGDTKNNRYKSRCEFIAPLDCLMWDRRLIEELFGFAYRWEIYTPAAKRKYGYYVLPVLYGERFIGRIEAAADKKAGVLTVKNIWFEEGIKQTKKMQAAIEQCIRRFAKFNECAGIIASKPFMF